MRLAGPEDDALVPIETEEWEGDVEEMQESIDQGWEPPPLLAEYQDGRLLLQDGNHRYEALVRAEENRDVGPRVLRRRSRLRSLHRARQGRRSWNASTGSTKPARLYLPAAANA